MLMFGSKGARRIAVFAAEGCTEEGACVLAYSSVDGRFTPLSEARATGGSVANLAKGLGPSSGARFVLLPGSRLRGDGWAEGLRVQRLTSLFDPFSQRASEVVVCGGHSE
jgi:hypothetical protein